MFKTRTKCKTNKRVKLLFFSLNWQNVKELVQSTRKCCSDKKWRLRSFVSPLIRPSRSYSNYRWAAMTLLLSLVLYSSSKFVHTWMTTAPILESELAFKPVKGLRRLFMLRFVERKAPYVNGKRDDKVKRTRREASNSVRILESRTCTKKEGKACASHPRVVSLGRKLISCVWDLQNNLRKILN